MGNKKVFGNAWRLDSQMSEPKLLVIQNKMFAFSSEQAYNRENYFDSYL